MTQHIEKQRVVERLNEAIDYPAGMEGLNTLLYGRARTRFAAVKQAVADRAEDLSQVTADEAAFLAQKDLANGKKTLNAWYWMVCGAEYDTQHPKP